jgi:sensor histidine kinase regulating citrate/malate metabolism
MIDNFVRNAEIHGFVSGSNRTENKIVIKITKGVNDLNLIVEIKNNGKRLPEELTVGKFAEFGNKEKNSSGEGLGGAYIDKVIRAHRGVLEITRGDKEYPVNFKITLPNLEGAK